MPLQTESQTPAEAYQVLKGRISAGDWRYERFMPEDQVWHWPVEWWNDEDGVPAFLRRPGPLREPCEACDQRSSLVGIGLLFGVVLREANRQCENCDGRSGREPPLGLIVSALHAIADRAESEGMGRVYVLGYARERRHPHPDTQEDLRWLTRDQWHAFNDAIPEAARATEPGAAPDPAPVLAILDSGITTQQFALRLWRAGVSARLTPKRQRQVEETLAGVPVRRQDSQNDVTVATRSRRVFSRREPANLTCLSNVDCDCVSYIAGIANRVVCSTCPDCRGSGLVPLIEFAEHEPCDDSRCDYQTGDVTIPGDSGWIIGGDPLAGAGVHLISSEYRERAEQQCDATAGPACARPTPDRLGRLGLQKLPDGTWVYYGAIEWQTTSQAHSARVPLGRLVLDARRRRIERAREKLEQVLPNHPLVQSLRLQLLLRRWRALPVELDRPTPAAPNWPEQDVSWRPG